MWTTPFTTGFNLSCPIIQAPMAGGATTAELVAAVSNAGGLGSLGAGYMAPNEINQAIIKIRQLTKKPFAVNLFIPEPYKITIEQMKMTCSILNQCAAELDIQIAPIQEPYAPSFSEQIKVLIDRKIPVFSFTFGSLSAHYVTQFKKNGTLLIGTATNLEEAQALTQAKVDAVVAQGSEAGGHRGSFLKPAERSLIPLHELLPELVNNCHLPIIAAGGIMNGEHIVQAIEAGAAAAQMGTAFLTCVESGISDAYKQVVLDQDQDNTVLTRAFSGKLARGIRNTFCTGMDKEQQHILDYPVQNALTTILRKRAKEKNLVAFMSLWAGQSVALCRNVSATELMQLLIKEMDAHLSDPR